MIDFDDFIEAPFKLKCNMTCDVKNQALAWHPM